MDKLTREQRSWNMSRIRSKNTTPEMRVRSFLHSNGFRFKLHATNLPGRPDIVLPKYKTVVFVHGCYWHRHSECKQGAYFPKDPKQGIDFWRVKFLENVQRDKINTEMLEELGWRVVVIWECETKEPSKLQYLVKNLNKFTKD
jgi:DNA mismatch endonuclease (patch repair protein)